MGLLHRLWQQWQKKTGDEDDAPHMQDAQFAIVPHFIDGERLTVVTEQTVEVFNPCNGRVERQLYAADTAQIEAAVAASLRAQEEWVNTTPATRMGILLGFRELLHASAEDLVQIIIQEQGFSRDMACGEIEYALRMLDDVPQWIQRLGGRYTPHALEHTDLLLLPKPVGIVLGVERSRLPVSASAWLISSALSCGNCVLLCPSPQHASAAVFLADLLHRAGLPNGVFNLIQGICATVDTLLAHPQINAAVLHNVSPQDVSKTSLAAVSRISLALTGDCRAAAIVMPDADMVSVAESLYQEFVSGCQNGQHLCAVIAVGDAGLTLGEALQRTFSTVPVHTTLPSLEVFHAALRAKESLRECGATILHDDDQVPAEGWNSGIMLADFITPDNPLLHQPHALPILPIIHAPNWAAAQAIIADNSLINSVGLFGTDLRILHRSASTIATRQIGLNTLVRRAHAQVGLAGVSSEDALGFFTRTRTVAHHW